MNMAQDWFERWCALLGSTTLDIRVKDLLQEMGSLKVPTIPRNEFEARVYSHGFVLVFHDAEMYPDNPGGGGSGVGILKEVNIFPQSDKDPYDEKLPYGLDRSDGRSQVAKKLGEPNEKKIKRNFEYWSRDNVTLRLKYSSAEDDAPISAISVIIELTPQGF
jgi:hypothetical protein